MRSPEIGLLKQAAGGAGPADHRISALPPEMQMLTGLAALDLCQNRLEIFPQVILKLPALEELQLYDNPRSSLPLEIARLARQASSTWAAMNGGDTPACGAWVEPSAW